LAGEHLARFLTFLHTDYEVDTVHVVAHSMGGLFSRAAFRLLQVTDSPIRIRSLTTMGTPWQGSVLGDYTIGTVDLSAAAGDAFSEKVMTEFRKRAMTLPTGAAQEVTEHYLMGPNGWNAFQAGVLDDIPVTLIGGSYFQADGLPQYWPHDGLVSEASALAVDLPTAVLPNRRTLSFKRTHSIFVSDQIGADWSTAMTWDPEVLEVVHEAIVAAA